MKVIEAMNEAALLRQVIEYLGYRGILATRHNSGHVRIGSRDIHLGNEGWPDIIGVLPDGRFLGIEVKTDTGRLRPSQREWFRRVPPRAVTFFARSVEDVERGLRGCV